MWKKKNVSLERLSGRNWDRLCAQRKKRVSRGRTETRVTYKTRGICPVCAFFSRFGEFKPSFRTLLEAGSLKGGPWSCTLCVFYVQVLLCSRCCSRLCCHEAVLTPRRPLFSILQSAYFDPLLLFPSLPAADVVVWYSLETFSWKALGCKPPPPDLPAPPPWRAGINLVTFTSDFIRFGLTLELWLNALMLPDIHKALFTEKRAQTPSWVIQYNELTFAK